MKIRELIDSIESGKTLDIEASFESVMADKVSSKLSSIREILATTMFNDSSSVEEETYISQEEFDALSEEEQNEYDLVESKDEDEDDEDEDDEDEDDEDEDDEDEDVKESKKSKK